MPKWSSYITRFLLLLSLCVMGLTALFYGLSSYLFTQIYTASNYASVTEGVTEARDALRAYDEGRMEKAELQSAVNPWINASGMFYMLLDENKQVIAYTEEAVPYFVGDNLNLLLAALQQEGTAIARHADEGTMALMVGEKNENGYILAGRPMRVYRGYTVTFHQQLLISMLGVLCLMLLLSTFTARRVARPARMITEMSGRLIEGEQVLIPENLPGQEIREIAKALNHMTRSVASAISDLRCEKETMALILEGLNEGILAVDEKGEILHENSAVRQLLGEKEGEAYQTVFSALLAEGKEEFEDKITRNQMILSFNISPLPVHNGDTPRGRVALIRDITEQERLERTRHDYVANISHELRTPLSSIRGLGEALRDDIVTEENDRQRYYNIIVEEATRLSRLVNDLLELSSLQSNPAAFEMERIDPNELIYELHDLNSRLFEEKKIAFHRQLPEEFLPDIRSNEDRLAQVLTIFLDNARKYTPEGGSVTLGAEKVEDGVRFFVRDTGVGMNEETRRMAFERFHQAEKGRSDKGSGLGLSIAREVLMKLGVEIQLESELGKGSEFAFVIPDGGNSALPAAVS